MNIKIIVYLLVIIFVFSCKATNNNENISIINLVPFSRDNFYRYETKQGQYFYVDNNKKTHSFTPIIYTNVMPLESDKSVPKRIYSIDTFTNDSKESRDYFRNKLNGISVSYIEKFGKIVYREFYQDYTGKDYHKKDDSKPRNIKDLEQYFENKNVPFQVLEYIKPSTSNISELTEKEKQALLETITSKTYKIKINHKDIYRITVDSSFCQSKFYYNQNDSIINYNKIIINFYR